MGMWVVKMGGVVLMGAVSWQVTSAEVLYFHVDHLGSTSVVTNSSGVVQQVDCYITVFGFGHAFSEL